MAVNRVVFVGLDDLVDGFPGGLDVLRFDLTVTAGRILPEALRGVTRDEVVFVVVDDGTEMCESTIKNLMRVNCTVVVVARSGVTRFETVTLPADSTAASIAAHLGISAAPAAQPDPGLAMTPPQQPQPVPGPAPVAAIPQPEPAPAQPAPAPAPAPAVEGGQPWDQQPSAQPVPAPGPPAAMAPPWEQPAQPAQQPWEQQAAQPVPAPGPEMAKPWEQQAPQPAPAAPGPEMAPPWEQQVPQPAQQPWDKQPGPVPGPAQPWEQQPEPVQPGAVPSGYPSEPLPSPYPADQQGQAPWDQQPAQQPWEQPAQPVQQPWDQQDAAPVPEPAQPWDQPAQPWEQQGAPAVPEPAQPWDQQPAPQPWEQQAEPVQPGYPSEPLPSPYTMDQDPTPWDQQPAPEPVYDHPNGQGPAPWDQQIGAPSGPPPVPADVPTWAQGPDTPPVPFEPAASPYPPQDPNPPVPDYQTFDSNPGYPPVPDYQTYDPNPGAPPVPEGPHMFQPATPQPGTGPWEDQPAGPTPRWMGGDQSPDAGVPGWAGGPPTGRGVGPVGTGPVSPWQAQPAGSDPQADYGRDQPGQTRMPTPTPSRGEADAPGKALAVLAPKGGVGKTGVTVWVTQAIGQALKQMGRTVGVIDANVGQGDVSKLLGMFRNTPDLAHLAHGRPVTETELDRVIQHVEWLNADCLFAPAEPMTVTTDAAVNALSSSLRLMRRRHSWTVIDCPVATSHDAIIRNFVAQEADLILMLVAPDGPTLDDAEVLMLELCAPTIEGGMAYPGDRVAVVLNRSDPNKTGIDLGMVESRFSSWRVLGEIPEIDHVKQDRNKGVNRVPDEAAHILAEIVSTVTDVSVEVPRFKMGRSGARRSKSQPASKGFLSRFKR